MEISYRRDLNHNYMILESEKITGNEYPVRMIEQNNIPELLPLQLRKMNGKSYLYYEITSRQPLSQIYENIGMRSRDIEQLLIGIRNGIEHAHQYLLNSEDILLEPEFIYINLGTGQIQLCCIPFLEKQKENPFLPLSEFILKKLDHGDRRAVDLGYDLFAQVSQDNFSLQECLKELLKEGQPLSEKKRETFTETIEEEPDIEENISAREGKETKVKKISWKNGILCGAVIAAVMLLFGGIVYFGRLDLTQTGGLAFLFLALIWIVYSVFQGRKQKKKKYWLEDEEDQEEDEWMETLLADLYDKREEEPADNTWNHDRKKREEWREGREWNTDRIREGGKKRIWEEDAGELDEVCGETRCLTESEYEPVLRLTSMFRSQYPDIELTKEKVIIGKKKDRVDVCLKQDCVSRIHARLEKQKENYFLTDLNSMNGTFVNGDRLRPNEKRQIYAGDRISFASLRYVVKQGS